MENRCISCGEIIPEGRQVCKECEVKAGMNRVGYRTPQPNRHYGDLEKKREEEAW